MLLEVIVQSVEDARAAEAGGADRLEVVRDIDRDGLTPSMDLVRAIAAATRLPLRVMVRESDGFSVSGPEERAALQRAVAACVAIGADGAVLGFARDGELDLETTRSILEAAPAACATFHRAFDTVVDPRAALDALRDLAQIDRILTSGGTGDWTARCRRLEELRVQAGERFTILAGGGVDVAGLRLLAGRVSVSEVHVGRAARDPQRRDAPVSAERVRLLRDIVGR